MEYNTSSFSGRFNTAYEGIANNLLRRFNETDSEMVKMEISRYMKQVRARRAAAGDSSPRRSM